MIKDKWRRRQGPALRVLCGILAVCAIAAGLLTGPSTGWQSALPMMASAVAALALTGWRERLGLVPVAAGAAAVSAAATLLGRTSDESQSAGVLTLVEIAALLLLVHITARFAPPRQALALGTVLGLLASTAMLRVLLPPTLLEAAAQSAFFALGAVAAAGVGSYLRVLEARRLRSVHEARRNQRLQLARDLHDFVAHDVSGIVVLAQAAQVVVAAQPQQVLPLLQQIEAAGLQALGSMDRTVRMLDGTGEPSGSGGGPDGVQTHQLSDIVDVVDRFRGTGRAEVVLDVDLTPEHVARVPREVAATACRTVVEALTNIRRHASTTPLVTVTVVPAPDDAPSPALTVRVANSAPSLSEQGALGDRGRRGGTGLIGLTERVEALGGTLEAGPDGADGWRITAVLPLAG
ncbi:sensor histidine kinase [Streptomyces sp. NPDC050504]|uniref:sensor histidine kinase n=1 Tax=Streptomyces sp. NPDC050504 TaxID=3365618 RepID=UPI0037B9109F